MKKLFSLLIVFISIKCFGQVYQVLPQYGYEMKRVNATLVLLLPSDTVTNKTGIARIGTVLYSGNGTKWTPATATDTTSLSNRINLKVNISDTAAMLSNYAKTSAVNLKVNISDTAAMLTNYAKTSAVNSGLALKVNISDTATMLTNYLRKIDTASLSSRINLKVNISDTATMLTPYAKVVDLNLKANINSPTFTGTVGGITQSMVGLGNVTNESKATMFTNATFTGTFATAAGAIGNASLANGAVANLSGTNTGDQTTITGNAGTATALQTARTIGTTTGDATSAGSSFNGTANNTNALTLATVNSNVGTFTNSTITVNGKGLITAASSGTGVGTVTSVAALTLGTSGTDLSSTVANSTTTPVITLNVPTASATNRGALSSTDWTAFNNKGSVSSVATDNATGITGGTITTTGTLAIDTIVISTRKWRQKGIDSVQANLTTGLALKVNIADTASMLSTYFRKVDTASLSNRINLKLNISDTSSMLSPYARTNSVNAGLALKVNISDTSTMLTPYLRKVDTTAMLSPYKTFYPRTAISLTTTGNSGAATYNNSTGVLNVPVYTDAFTGTVTSVATNNGSGITGGTITTSGTLAIDTLLISTRAWRKKGIDSVVALIPSLTSYVPYTGATTDVDLGAFKLNAQSLHVKGTAGNGHLGLKHQSSSATATANESSLFADTNGDMSYQNANLYLNKFVTSANTANRTYTFPDATGTVALVGGAGVGTVTSVAALTLGTSGTDLNSSVANGTTSPVITLNVPTASATNRGALSSADWTTFNGKESVLTFSSPLVRTTNTISIPAATTSVNGYLSSTDWTTFNSKQGTITLTTTGTSGAATFSANTLNIPNYGSALSGYLPLAGGTLTGALSGTSASFSSTLITGGGTLDASTPQIQSSGTIMSTGSSLAAAPTTASVVLDYQSAGNTGRLMAGSAAAWNKNISINPYGGNVGIGTTSPAYLLHTKGSGSFNGTILSDNSSTTGSGSFQVGVNGTSIGGVQASGNIIGNTDQNLSLYSAAGLGLKVFVNATATPVFTIASTGAATFSGQYISIQGAQQNSLWLNQNAGGTSTGFLLGRSYGSTNSQDFFIYDVASATRVLAISSTGAATFSSSVTATQGNFNQTATSGSAINMSNRNNNQTWGLVVDTDAVDDKILGFQSSYGFTPFYALKLDAVGGAATFSSSIKTSAPSGGTAKPFKIGAAATVTPTSQNRTIEIEIDGVTYYLTAKTTND